MHIPTQEKPYQDILQRSGSMSHQYDQPADVIREIVNRIWVFQNYHVTEFDAEGYRPVVQQDTQWHEIDQWLQTRAGLQWLLSHRDWNQKFEQHLVWQILQLQD